MTCANCGSSAVGIAYSGGSVNSGPFYEYYECDICGADGLIRGNAAAPPMEWKRTGRVFD